MIFKKEYKEDKKIMGTWLPFSALIDSNIMRNKDGSLMGFLSYDAQNNSTNDELKTAIKELAKLLDLPSGWGMWIEKAKMLNNIKYYLTFCWNPVPDKDGYVDFPKEFYDKPIIFTKNFEKDIEICLENFKKFMERAQIIIGKFINARLVNEKEILNYLSWTISSKNNIDFPETPLYLDYYLSQDNTYTMQKGQFVINDLPVTTLSLLGYPEVDEVLREIDALNINYRFIRRFIYFGEEDVKKEIGRYMENWCEGRKNMLKFLGYKKNRRCGYYNNFIVLLTPNKEIVDKINEIICSNGIPVSRQVYKDQMDTWFASVPGMFRSCIHSPLVEIQDISDILLIPEILNV